MRTPLVAGNWKMYKTASETKAFMDELVQMLKGNEKAEVLICSPYTSLHVIKEYKKNYSIKLGAQDVHWEEEGAYTGKISCNMLIDLECDYVIIGHSEQRTYFHETDETVNKKVKKVLSKNLIPIVCVGETLQQRDNNQHKEVVKDQILKGFKDISDIKNTVIAYEPVWAIGTGRNATPEQAQEMQKFIRDIIKDLYGNNVANAMRILYGGSLKPENAKEIFAQPDIDGGLIGGASLKPKSFYDLITSAG